MSVRIGEVDPRSSITEAAVHVHASRAGVELLSDPRITLEPTQARNYAALLVRGADEVERMRARPEIDDAKPCSTCGKPGHRPMDHAGWDPTKEGHG